MTSVGLSCLLLSLFLIVFLLPIGGGIAIILLSRRPGSSGTTACGACGYDVSATLGIGRICPECGRDLAHVGVIGSRSTRKRGLMWLGIALIVMPTLTLALTVLLPGLSAQRSLNAARQQAQAVQAAAQAQQQLQQQVQQQPQQQQQSQGQAIQDGTTQLEQLKADQVLQQEQLEALKRKLEAERKRQQEQDGDVQKQTQPQ